MVSLAGLKLDNVSIYPPYKRIQKIHYLYLINATELVTPSSYNNLYHRQFSSWYSFGEFCIKILNKCLELNDVFGTL